MKCVVKLIWDVESKTWYTQTDDIPGLALGAPFFDELVERVRLAAPEMLELNCGYTGDVRLIFKTKRTEILAAAQ